MSLLLKKENLLEENVILIQQTFTFIRPQINISTFYHQFVESVSYKLFPDLISMIKYEFFSNIKDLFSAFLKLFVKGIACRCAGLFQCLGLVIFYFCCIGIIFFGR